MESRAKIDNWNALLIVYAKPDGAVVHSFLIGETAGSLSIGNDGTRLREFAEAVLESLEGSENQPNNVVRHVAVGRRTASRAAGGKPGIARSVSDLT